MRGTSPIDLFRRSAQAAFEKAGEQIVEKVKDQVSVPVQYVAGPRGGRHAIRSKPGEYPRRDTGALQASVATSTIDNQNVIQTAVEVGVPYAPKLVAIQRKLLIEGMEEFSKILDGEIRSEFSNQ